MVENHSLFVYSSQSSSLTANNQMTEVTVYCVDSSLEDFMHRTDSFVPTGLYYNFDYVAATSATVQVCVGFVNGNTIDSPFYLA